jgi:hypothetical protein
MPLIHPGAEATRCHSPAMSCSTGHGVPMAMRDPPLTLLATVNLRGPQVYVRGRPSTETDVCSKAAV